MKEKSQLKPQVVSRRSDNNSKNNTKRQMVLDDVVSLANSILSEYSLCDSCLGRMFSYKLGLVSHRRLGKRIKLKICHRYETKQCSVCKGTMSEITSILSELVSATKDYEFSTFLIGATLPPSVLDKDDEIRSKFKLMGEHGIKNALTRELGKRFARKSRATADFRDPDLILHVDVKKASIDVKSKPLYFTARYTKKEGKLSQRAPPCQDCRSKGCLWCDFTGIVEHNNSIEGKISSKLREKLGAQQLRINWVGGEDKDSLVLGKGRPIFVKVINPCRRNLNDLKKIQLGEGIKLYNIRPIQEMPKASLKFTNTVFISIKTQEKIKKNDLQEKIRKLDNLQVTISENPKKRVIRKILSVKDHHVDSDSSPDCDYILLHLESEGGIPLKRFVSGKGGVVEPNLSKLFGTSCECVRFDFKDVHLQEDFY